MMITYRNILQKVINTYTILCLDVRCWPLFPKLLFYKLGVDLIKCKNRLRIVHAQGSNILILIPPPK